jgi:hypothetical protein
MSAGTDNTAPRLEPSEVAWLLVVPCALLAVAAMLLLGRPLGQLLLSNRTGLTFLPELRGSVFPKPAEQMRYLMALAAAVALVGGTVLITRSTPRVAASRYTRGLVSATQWVGALFVVACVWAQREFVYGAVYGTPTGFIQPYFTIRTLVLAGVVALVGTLAILRDRVPQMVARALGASRRGIGPAAVTVALIVTATWMISGVVLDSTVVNADYTIFYHIRFDVNEAFAVLDGRSPLVNLASQYASLWPYFSALVMSELGATLGVFSVTMCAITAASLLAVFDVLRRVTGRPIVALLLYLPFLANSLFGMHPGLVNRYGPVDLYSVFPLRYAGPYLLLWCTARHLDGTRPRGRWLLFLVAGLVVLNNGDFGVPALGASFAALLVAEGLPRVSHVKRLIGEVIGGLAGAYVLVSILTLARGGSLPDIGLLFSYARIFAVGGFGMLPTPTLGLHVVIYLTYVAALGTAAVRAMRDEEGRMLTALLAWSGIFGLGVGSYFMGRSHSEVLVSMFSAWTLALVLLAIALARDVISHPGRRSVLVVFATIFGLAVASCSLAETPAPWTQIERLRHRTPSLDVATAELKRVLRRYGDGKPEAILSTLGYREAYEAGVENVAPYAGVQSIMTVEQLDETLSALRKTGGHLLVLPMATPGDGFYRDVCKAGFSYMTAYENVNFEVLAGQKRGLTLWSAPVPGVAPRRCPV